jgi:ABC-2 type transport system ATP-binding protein
MPGTSRAAIRTEALTKYYGRVIGLESLTLEIPEGAVFGFLGPNGAGKTTTIRLLLDLIRPSSGSASICGFDCRRQSVAARGCVGHLPGELPALPGLTGAAFLRYLAALGGRPVAQPWLAHLLQRFDVSDTDLGRPMREYSQGMKRKLGVIQALMTHPPVVVLDEPTAGLDPLMIEAFAETIHELRQRGDTTVFLSSHVLSEVERTCDLIGLVRRGRLAAVRSLAELRRERAQRVSIDFSTPVDGHLPVVAGATLVSRTPTGWVIDVRGPLGPLVIALSGFPVQDLRIERFELEDYVLGFYTEGGPA